MRTLILIILLSLALVSTLGTSACLTARAIEDLRPSRAEAASYRYEPSEYSYTLKSANSEILTLKDEIATLRSKLETAKRTIIDLEEENSYQDEVITYLGRKTELRQFTDGTAFEAKMKYYSCGFTVLKRNACVDIALTLVRLAREDGYLISTEIIQDGRHMVVSTVLENGEIWFYDYNTKSAWLVYKSN